MRRRETTAGRHRLFRTAHARVRYLLWLDCGWHNDALRCYYAQQGFRPVGRRDAEGRWYSVVLPERPLRDAAA